MFRLMVMNVLLMCLILMMTSTASGRSKELRIEQQSQSQTRSKRGSHIFSEGLMISSSESEPSKEHQLDPKAEAPTELKNGLQIYSETLMADSSASGQYKELQPEAPAGKKKRSLIYSEETPVWNNKACSNHGGYCVRIGKSCPEHLQYETSPGEPFCTNIYRCCYSEPCEPTTCTYQGQTGNCSLDSLPGTTAVGSQDCKKGCQCYIKENSTSCSLVWDYEEDSPLIMIRESKTIVPPITDINISNDPNRIPEGKQLVFACPGENNQFNHVEGTHTKLHGECVSPELFAVCVNDYQEIMDLSQLSCSRKMSPSIIKQDNDTSYKTSCDDIGGELYKLGYIYGDYKEFKDLETKVCFREKDQTTLWTSTNNISPRMRYKDPPIIRTSRGFEMNTFNTQKSQQQILKEVLDKETTSVWNDMACRNHEGHCFRGGEHCPKQFPYQTSQGEPFCSSFYRCCYSEPCEPTTCKYKDQAGSCSLQSLAGTTEVGSQECKKGCQCYIKDNTKNDQKQNTRTNSECSVGSGTTLLACKNLNGKCVPRLEACPKCQPLVTPPGNPYCLKDYHCCYSGLTERFVQQISTSARVNQVTFEDDDVSGEDDVSQRFKRQAVFSPKYGCLREQLLKGLFDLDHQIRISKNIPIGTTAFSNPPLIDSAMEFMDWKTNPVISVNNPLFKVTDEDILYDLNLKGMDNFRQAWSNLKAPTENDLKHFQSMVMDMDAMKQSLPDDAADPLTMKFLEHYFRGDRKGMEYTGIHDGFKSIAYGENKATPYTGGDVLNIVPFATARVVSIRNAKIKWNDNEEFVKPGITTVVYGMPPVYQTRFLLSAFYEQQTRLQLQKNVGIQIIKDKTNPKIWGTGFFYV